MSDSRGRILLFWVVVSGAVVVAGETAAAEGLSAYSANCAEHIESLRSQAALWRWVLIATTACGGLVASATGLKAGMSPSDAGRPWGYAALVSGAIAASSPLLPKPEEFSVRAALADRQYIMGLKVERQVEYLDAKASDSYQKYAIARFTDCLAEEPPEQVPDLPPGTMSGPAVFLNRP